MSDRYARVYFDRMARDPKFDGIRNDNHVMGSWLLLLIEAEKAWPAPAFRPPPAWVPVKHFRTLVDRKVIDEEPDGRYRMHGLDSERSGRSNRAKHAADAKWAAAGNAGSSADSSAAGNADASASRARAVSSPSGSSLSVVEGGVGGETATSWETAAGRTLLASGNYAFTYIEDAVTRHGDAKVAAAVARARGSFTHVPESNALATAVKRLLDPFPDGKSLAAAEREAERDVASKRGVEDTLRRIHGYGAHEAERHPACPSCLGVAS